MLAGRPDAALHLTPGTSYTVVARSDVDAPLVAQVLTGPATALGSIEPALRWAFARRTVPGGTSTTLSFFNPGASPATVDIAVVDDGAMQQPRSLRAVEVPAGQRVDVTVVGGENPTTNDAALLIESNAPVFVERSIVRGNELTRTAGIPLP